MKLKLWLEQNSKVLAGAGVPTARLDCLVLLEDLTGKTRGWLLAHPDFLLNAAFVKQLDAQITRRMHHEPLAYIRGKSEFYGRQFNVNAHTLEPRPETETMVELFLQRVANEQSSGNLTIVDVGTGSGCIAITVKLELPEAEVIGIDIDKKCLNTAQKNATTLGASVQLLHGDLLMPISSLKLHDSQVIVLANLPYVPDSYRLNSAAEFEPRHAIFGGTDGLDYYRALFRQLLDLPMTVQAVYTEALPFQHAELRTIAQQAGYLEQLSDDLIQIFTSK